MHLKTHPTWHWPNFDIHCLIGQMRGLEIIQIHLCVYFFTGGSIKRKKHFTTGQLQILCTKYSCWNTLITYDHYHLLFLLLITAESLQCFQSYTTESINLESTQSCQTLHVIETCWRHPPLHGIIYYTLLTDLEELQLRLGEGRGHEWIHHWREPVTQGWPDLTLCEMLYNRNSGKTGGGDSHAESLRRRVYTCFIQIKSHFL